MRGFSDIHTRLECSDDRPQAGVSIGDGGPCRYDGTAMRLAGACFMRPLHVSSAYGHASAMCVSSMCQLYVWLASVVHHQSPVVAGELVVGLVVGLGFDAAWVVRVIVDPLSTVWPA